LHQFDDVAVGVGNKSDLLAGTPGKRAAIRSHVHRSEVFERLGQIVYEQTKVKITDRVRRLFDFVFAIGEKLDTLALGELQKHQLRSLAFRLCVKNFLGAESISIPADAALYIGNFESDMPESNPSDSHRKSSLCPTL
jgi:hypothetical protein